MREQFLVEIDPAGAGCEVAWLAELNRLFTAWCHAQYHRCVHTETGATPAQRYHAPGRTPAPRPDPALLRRAGLWREQRRVTTYATVALHGNRYQVDAALAGRVVDLLFTPFDLTVVEVEFQGRAMGQAVPHRIGRHIHPAVKPGAAAPVEATGIDYLRLLDDAHQKPVGQAINYPALTGDNPEPCGGDPHQQTTGDKIEEAVRIVRGTRQTVHLGLPTTSSPALDPNLEGPA